MFQLINEERQSQLIKIFSNLEDKTTEKISEELLIWLNIVREEIPEKKKISYGRYSIMKKAGTLSYSSLQSQGINMEEPALKIFRCEEVDPFVRCLALQIKTEHTLKQKTPEAILPLFKEAAENKTWEIRECAAGLIRPLVRNHKKILKDWYLKSTESQNPLLRRFVSESLRPVVENRWMHKEPDYPLSIIRRLFTEHSAYPRTSVGNNLSDWMRVNTEYTLPMVKQLASSGNPDSYWIAYRACRNYIKTNPEEVFNILKIESYKYKNKTYYK